MCGLKHLKEHGFLSKKDDDQRIFNRSDDRAPNVTNERILSLFDFDQFGSLQNRSLISPQNFGFSVLS